ncbi:hypothetical protein D8674_026000 [Pyrus ussuriensis x Pyrus communis]|uniref:Reverse transcriptase Ty1/copia-type domain-containing protein n=1 Tax=Pyrus ussuriensis x Pyrus communis TaxID=2448454 RepID=A0A5N5I5Q5_9ROSA|nr:hypothetical protein D8674_026000 [Pyrus ussuriensis x Pyrus communis]
MPTTSVNSPNGLLYQIGPNATDQTSPNEANCDYLDSRADHGRGNGLGPCDACPSGPHVVPSQNNDRLHDEVVVVVCPSAVASPSLSNSSSYGAVNSSGKVCRLRKALYGLKQSLIAWFGRFTQVMKKYGYRQGNVDHTLFIKRKDVKVTLLIICVDDTMEIKRLQGHLSSEFEMNDLGGLKYFLGVEVARPDIAYAVSVVSQFMHAPSEHHMVAVMRILSYLKGALRKGLMYRKHGHMEVKGYIDADWAGNITYRRSKFGYFTFVAAFKPKGSMLLYCDNQAAREIANNLVQHDRTQHIEVDRHFIKEKLDVKLLADILTHAVSARRFQDSLDKLGLGDIYAPT